MNVVVSYNVIDDSVLNSLVFNIRNHVALGYRTMEPIQSPLFANSDLVMDWYKKLPVDKQVQFVRYGIYAVYECQYAPKDMILYGDYPAKKGEEICIDEWCVYDFQLKKWL